MSIAKSLKRIEESTTRMNEAMGEINDKLIAAEKRLWSKPLRKVVAVQVSDNVQLAWSGAKGSWRLVLRSEDEIIDLARASREERIEVITSGALQKLLEQVFGGTS